MATQTKKAKRQFVETQLLEFIAGIIGCCFVYRATTLIDVIGSAMVTALLIWLARDLGEYLHRLREEQKRAAEQLRLATIKAEREAREREKERLAEQQRREEIRKERELQYLQRSQARQTHTTKAARQISVSPANRTKPSWSADDIN